MTLTWKTFSRKLRLPLRPRWALHFGGKGYMTGSSMQIPSEIAGLARIAVDLKPRLSLEIGTAHGGTPFIWSQLKSDEILDCDIRDRSCQESFYVRFPPPGSARNVRLCSGDSHDAGFKSRVKAALGRRKLDLLLLGLQFSA